MINMQKSSMRTQGMTLIEVIVVLMVVGILIGLIAPGVMKWVRRAERNKTEVLLKGLKTQIVQYKTDTYQYPNTLIDLARRPSDPNIRWKSAYIEDENELIDAWGNAVVYRKNAQGSGKRPFELYSWGAEGEGSPQEDWVDVWSI